MKSVLMSIQPKWCELIASGKKTVEVRKTRPKIETPFKVYIYCTQDKKFNFCTDNGEQYTHIGNGKVIGEFICNEITVADYGYYCVLPKSKTMLDELDLLEYADQKAVYGWHISDLKIYDKPKELYEFYRKCEKQKCEACEHLKYQRVNPSEYDYDCEYIGGHIPITRPPQSWCYVEEVRE